MRWAKRRLSAATALMALVAVDAVVDIPRHILVVEVGGVVATVTAGALEDGVVIGIDVAG